MANSDMSFISALMRIRTRAYQSGVASSEFLSAHEAVDFKTQSQFFSSLPHALDVMKQVSAMGGAPSIDLRSRWVRSSRTIDTSSKPHAFAAGVQTHVQVVGSAAGTDGLIPVQDLFAAVSHRPPPISGANHLLTVTADVDGVENHPRLDPRPNVFSGNSHSLPDS